MNYRFATIQRCIFEDREDRKGIDGVLIFDYMGYAEYEFGALNKSLKHIRNSFSSYGTSTVSLATPDGISKLVTMFAPVSIMAEYTEFLQDLAADKVRNQGVTYFIESLRYDSKRTYTKAERFSIYDKPLCWWDIGTNVLFWIENPEHEKKILNAIQPPVTTN